MKIKHAQFLNNNIMYGSQAHKARLKNGNIQEMSATNIEPNRPAERVSLSGSERYNKKNGNPSFTGNPKLVTNIAKEVLDTSRELNIPKWAEKMGGANWFDKVLGSVQKNETFYEAVAALVVAGIMKPVCVLAMPGAEKEDKEMSATKNAVSALIGFGLSNLILSPCSNAVNKINDSLFSKNPTKYIKNAAYVDALKSEELITTAAGKQLKSTLGDAFTTTYKKIPDIGVSPLKAGLTIAFTPVVLNVLFKKDKKKKPPKPPQNNPINQMAIMNSIRMDINKGKAAKEPSFTGSNKNPFMQKDNIQNQPSFTGASVSQIIDISKEEIKRKKSIFARAKDKYCNFIGEPLAKLMGKVAPTKPAQKIVEGTAHFEKPSPRWSDLASVAITFFYINNTRKSEKIDEERKLPLMINNFMVTVASSTAAFLIDKFTDKPMENLLRSYLTKHEVEMHDKSNKHIKKVLSNVLSGEADYTDARALMRHSDDLLEGGLEGMSSHLKDAIKALSKDEVVQKALKRKIISTDDIAKMAASGFEKQASSIYKLISKAKSLTIFTLTVRFLVTVLMTPVVGKVVAHVNKKLGRNKDGQETNINPAIPPAGSETIGMKDYISSLKK